MTLSTPAEVAAWERAYDAAIAAGMQESAGTFADRKIVELRKRQEATQSLRSCRACKAPLIACGYVTRRSVDDGEVYDWHAECAPRITVGSPPVARERLGEWSPVDGGGACRFGELKVGMRACSDGTWWVRLDDGRLKHGTATIGTFPTLLAAAQHAADSSAEARERYEWEGQEYPVCADCDRPATHNEALIFAAGVGRDARWVHDPVCPRETIPAPTPPDHLANAGKMVAPQPRDETMIALINELWQCIDHASTCPAGPRDSGPCDCYVPALGARVNAAIGYVPESPLTPIAPTQAEVEAAIEFHSTSQIPLFAWDYLGWTLLEYHQWQGWKTIPARPLRTHEAAPAKPSDEVRFLNLLDDLETGACEQSPAKIWPARKALREAFAGAKKELAEAIQDLNCGSDGECKPDIRRGQAMCSKHYEEKLRQEIASMLPAPTPAPIVDVEPLINGNNASYDGSFCADCHCSHAHSNRACNCPSSRGFVNGHQWRKEPIPPRVYDDAFLDECARWANEQLNATNEKSDRRHANNALTDASMCSEWAGYVRDRAAQLDAVPTPVVDTLSPVNGTRAHVAVRKAAGEVRVVWLYIRDQHEGGRDRDAMDRALERLIACIETAK